MRKSSNNLIIVGASDIATKPKAFTRVTWDVSKLLSPSSAKKYDELVSTQLGVNWRFGKELNEQWDYLCFVACSAAQKLFKHQPVLREPKLQDSHLELERQLRIVTRVREIDRCAAYQDSNDSPPQLLPGALANLSAARRNYTKLLHETRLKKLDELINDMEDTTHVGERLQMAFKYLKPIRRAITSSTSQITLRQWHCDLQNYQGNSVALIVEDDHFPLTQPPSFEKMMDVIARMKNGKSPGLDLITIEMFKASPTLCNALYAFIINAYETAEVPASWQTTVSQPIPKKPHPQGLNEYRKITLGSVGYKVHATLLLQTIKPFLPVINEYQSGFLPNRSCDDLIFVMKQVLDVRWNHGQSTYILSLDLENFMDG